LVRAHSLPAKLIDLYVITENFADMAYFPERSAIPAGATVIDIGAHIGAFSLYAASAAPKSKVYAFEPFPPNFSFLKKNIALNSFSNVMASDTAISKDNSPRELFVNPLNSSGHSLTKKTSKAVGVKCRSLEKIFADFNINFCDFLKLDCEGGEYDILFAAPKSILDKIGIISMEYHSPHLFDVSRDRRLPEKLAQYLREAGFTVDLRHSNRERGYIYATRARHPSNLL